MPEVALASRVAPAREHEAGRRVTSWAVVGAMLVVMGVVAVVALVLTGGRPRSAPAGLPDAGAFTGWALPMARAAMDLGAVGTIGSLLVAAFLVPAVNGRLGATGRKSMHAAAWWAWGWAGSAAALGVLSISDVLGVPVTTVLLSPALLSYGWQLPVGRALVVMSLAAFAIALNARSVRSPLGSLLLLLGATFAMVPLVLAGHSASAADHYVASQALLVHVLAASIWVGGLLGLVLLVRGDGDALRFAVPRFSTLALLCFVTVAVSGSVTGWTRLGLSWDSWSSTYGALVAAKSLGLLLLGIVGLIHRRYAVARVVAGLPRSFARLAVVEVLLMAATVAVAVVLSRTAPPVGVGLEADASHVGTFATLSQQIAPFDITQLLAQWRPDALVVTAVLVAAIGYLLAVRHVRRLGYGWPSARVGWTMAGLTVVLFALCGSLGTYSTALFSVQVAQFLTMLTVVPILINLGSPLRLARLASGVVGSPGTSDLGARVADPVNGVVVMVALILGVYATPVLDASLRSATAHLLVNVLALAVGLTVFRSVRGGAGLPETRSSRERALLILVPAGMLIVLAVTIWRADSAYGSAWFQELNIWWTDPAADQHLAAMVAGGWALALAMLSAGLALRSLADDLASQTHRDEGVEDEQVHTRGQRHHEHRCGDNEEHVGDRE